MTTGRRQTRHTLRVREPALNLDDCGPLAARIGRSRSRTGSAPLTLHTRSPAPILRWQLGHTNTRGSSGLRGLSSDCTEVVTRSRSIAGRFANSHRAAARSLGSVSVALLVASVALVVITGVYAWH